MHHVNNGSFSSSTRIVPKYVSMILHQMARTYRIFLNVCMFRLQMTPATQLRELHAGIGRGSKASSPPAHPKPPLSPSPSLRCLQTADKDQARLSYQQQHVVAKQCSLHCLLKARVDSVLNLATCAARLRSPAPPAQTPQLGEAATAARERSGEGWEVAPPRGRRPGRWRAVGR